MQLRYRFRLYPDDAQRAGLAQTFGNARVVFNDAIRVRRYAYQAGEKYPSGTQLQKRLITDAKRTAEREWLAYAQHSVLQQVIRDCDTAFRNFFDSLSGKRKGRRVGAPRFKSRKDRRQAVRFQPDGFRVLGNGKLRLSKVGDVKVAWSRDLPSTPSSVTVVKTADERYFVSFVVETGDDTLPPAVDEHGQEHELALDLGLHAFAVDQHGNAIENPKFLRRAERKLKRAQRELSRKQRGSNNRDKARRKVARQHGKVADTRADWLHQETTRIVRENQAIYLEDLAVSGLARTRLAKSVHDASWGGFRRMVEYKAARHGRELVVIDRWLPTSKTCSGCGVVQQSAPLSMRTFECAACGLVLDRDTNAARNILAAGRAERRNACGADVRPPSEAVGVEAGSSGSPRGSTAPHAA
ncbi:putative transposase [Saccharopolyspora lacisalsi]|uniref:Putative transposase n=1 Tax=Halosaccharopolyspora lacisalsi TaxID=1000566 RepID=A0A839E681_9PSEU|nr:RNA-guided endonuclease TnpB family protein [Halosaccharopolyspora lacisalsi]MBA8826398.1 putative transposase [Halosaccharopolyspora lacisalsi]